MEKVIFHLDMDSFFVSVERILDPSLIGKPVAVGGPAESRGVVSCASYEARQFGVHSAMSSAKAKVLCPELIFVGSGHSAYSEYSNIVKKILLRHFPKVEQTSIDEFYLDYSGCSKLSGAPLLFAKKIKKYITKRTGLPFSIGIGSNKLIAKTASKLAKPNGVFYVMPGSEEDFLAPLPIKMIQGIGKVTGDKLQELGVNYVSDIARIPRQYMESLFGKAGLDIIKKAGGQYESSRVKVRERKSLSTERTFSEDFFDKEFLESAIFYLTVKSMHKLRSLMLSPRKVTLKIRYGDFKTVTSCASVRPYASDVELFYKFRDIFRKIYNRRVGLRLIGVKFSHFIKTDAPSFDIMRDKNIDKQALYKKIDAIKDKFGFDSINFARAVNYEEYRYHRKKERPS